MDGVASGQLKEWNRLTAVALATAGFCVFLQQEDCRNLSAVRCEDQRGKGRGRRTGEEDRGGEDV